LSPDAISDQLAKNDNNEPARSRRAARAVELACISGDVGEFHDAIQRLDETDDGWRLAMGREGRLEHVSDEIRNAFLYAWIDHNNLMLRVDHRPTLARALRVLLPRTEVAEPLVLFRGAVARERRHRTYGFAWTTDIDEARNFARGKVAPALGRFPATSSVVLRTLAAPNAILYIRARSEGQFYDEHEVIVDPFRLGRIEVMERMTPPTPHA
jgi:hypothetical protein